jgi:Immunity protein 42
MIVGDLNTFAIESEITLAYDRLNEVALGFFAVHIMGRCYGVRKPDATMLADPFNEVVKRITKRGSHNPVFPMTATAANIAYSFRRAIYDESKDGELFFGMSVRQFTNAISSNRLEWTAYCDEAFDDSSYVLQFEDDNQVRLVAFTGTPDFRYDPTSLRDVRLSPDAFYGILQEWHERFRNEWSSWPKVPESIQ